MHAGCKLGLPSCPNLTITCAAGMFAPLSDLRAISGLIFSSWMNVFLVSIPLGFCAYFLNWGAVPIFVLVSHTGLPAATPAAR